MDTYQIIDEPRPGKLSRLTVNPMWPLFAFMFGGALYSWIWSVVNSLALNSANKNKELTVLALGFITFVGFYVAIGVMLTRSVLVSEYVDYIKMVIVCVELGFCYRIYLWQESSFEIHEYFDGRVATPAFGLLGAFVIGRGFEAAIIGSLLTGVR